MLCVVLDASLQSVRQSKKNPAKYYGDFLYAGGSGSYLLPVEDVAFYQSNIGKDLQIACSVRVRQIPLFSRSVTMFEPFEVLPKKKAS